MFEELVDAHNENLELILCEVRWFFEESGIEAKIELHHNGLNNFGYYNSKNIKHFMVVVKTTNVLLTCCLNHNESDVSILHRVWELFSKNSNSLQSDAEIMCDWLDSGTLEELIKTIKNDKRAE